MNHAVPVVPTMGALIVLQKPILKTNSVITVTTNGT